MATQNGTWSTRPCAFDVLRLGRRRWIVMKMTKKHAQIFFDRPTNHGRKKLRFPNAFSKRATNDMLPKNWMCPNIWWARANWHSIATNIKIRPPQQEQHQETKHTYYRPSTSSHHHHHNHHPSAFDRTRFQFRIVKRLIDPCEGKKEIQVIRLSIIHCKITDDNRTNNHQWHKAKEAEKDSEWKREGEYLIRQNSKFLFKIKSIEEFLFLMRGARRNDDFDGGWKPFW